MMLIGRSRAWLALIVISLVTAALYWPGLNGTFFFDDHPNIVDNKAVQPSSFTLANLSNAALSSPASEFKRPLASLTFAANFLATGLSPFWFKLTNLLIHLANGLLLYLVTVRIWRFAWPDRDDSDARLAALLVTAAWLVLPINLTAVLYVVQRMESLANLFVLLGLLGYLQARRGMLEGKNRLGWACASLLGAVACGALAKETAIMLPLYAAILEYSIIRRRDAGSDRRVDALFAIILGLPLVVGGIWLWPKVFSPEIWEHRDFTLTTRLMTEARVVVDYVGWTIVPTPRALSFYHDDFGISKGLLSPPTTILSMLVLGLLAASCVLFRKKNPTYAAGIALFLGSNLLTATVLPLELVYEHRNYFASIGILLALVSILRIRSAQADDPVPPGRPGLLLLGALLIYYGGLTCLTAVSWGDPLKMAAELAWRAPQSPRAQYELGRTYVIYSHYDVKSRFTQLAYAPLERAASLPEASILPLQALIFMNSRMNVPIKDSWWDSLTSILRSRRARVEDESSLISLAQCLRIGECEFPAEKLMEAFQAALSHRDPSSRLLGAYGDFAWNTLKDRGLAERVTRDAIAASPAEPAYRISLARMLIEGSEFELAAQTIRDLVPLNYGGRLQGTIDDLNSRLKVKKAASKESGTAIPFTDESNGSER